MLIFRQRTKRKVCVAMRTLLKIAILLCSLSSLTIPQAHNSSDSSTTVQEKVKAISSLALAAAILYPLQYISTYAHEYGHALPHIVSGKEYNVTVERAKGWNPLMLYEGAMSYFQPSSTPLLTTILGPTAGIATKYIHSVMVQVMRDRQLGEKSLLKSLGSALKSPITAIQDIITQSEDSFSYLINSKQQTPKKEEPNVTWITKPLQAMMMLSMFREFIYGFLPQTFGSNEPQSNESYEMISDGEKIWRYLLGSKPTFSVDPTSTTIGFGLGLVGMGAMKAIIKKYTKNQDSDQKSDDVKKSEDETLSKSKMVGAESEKAEESILKKKIPHSSDEKLD